jgi:hypothetical protein
VIKLRNFASKLNLRMIIACLFCFLSRYLEDHGCGHWMSRFEKRFLATAPDAVVVDSSATHKLPPLPLDHDYEVTHILLTPPSLIQFVEEGNEENQWSLSSDWPDMFFEAGKR